MGLQIGGFDAASRAHAQRYRINYKTGVLSQREVQRQQLTRMWVAAIEVDRSRGGVDYLAQSVSYKRGAKVYDVKIGGKTIRSYSQQDRDQFGDVLGEERAKDRAISLANSYKSRGKEAKVEEIVIPEITIFASTSGGLVHAIDGETGQTRWAVNYGSRDYPTLEVGANDEYIGVVNGSTLYIADRNHGRVKWSRRLVGVPAAGPVLSDTMAFVSTVGGALEAYNLEDTYLKIGRYNAPGRSETRPTLTNTTVAWTTSAGYVYTADANTIGVRYSRYLGRPIDSGIAHASPQLLIAATADGFIECMDELRLTPVWKLAIAEPVYRTPVAVGENLYVITDTAGLYSLRAENGAEQWFARGVKTFLSATERRVYCADNIGRVAILDAKRGGRLGVLNTQGAGVKMLNMDTDRIILASRTGLIQCLRETANVRPLIHFAQEKAAEEPTPEKGKETPKETKKKAEPAVEGIADDPFSTDDAGGGGDVFGGGAGGGDVFGGDAGGAGGSGADDDPFK